jgi:hypothetical protein
MAGVWPKVAKDEKGFACWKLLSTIQVEYHIHSDERQCERMNGIYYCDSLIAIVQ